MTKVYTYMIPIYAMLVKGGRYAIDADNNPDKLPVIPKRYQELVAIYLAEQEARVEE